MRHPERDKRSMHYAPYNESINTTTGEVIRTYGTTTAFKAILQPLMGQLQSTEHGNRLPMSYALLDHPQELVIGCGIWIDAPTTGAPDYSVIKIHKTPRESIAELEKRGAFGG